MRAAEGQRRRQRRRDCRRPRGFTLIEVMVVVVIVGILASVALGVGSQTVRRARARDDKEAVRVLLIQARNHARRMSTCVRVTRTSSSQLDAALFVGAGCPAQPLAVAPSPSTLKLSPGNAASLFDDNGTGSPTLTFFPDGATHATGPIRLTFTDFAGGASGLLIWPGAGIVAEER